MTESDLHFMIKRKVAEGLQELGYDTKLEAVVNKGRVDVLATKDGEELKVEVSNTHTPEWVLVEMKRHNSIPENNKTKRTKEPIKKFMMSCSKTTADKLKKQAMSKNMTLQMLIRNVITPWYLKKHGVTGKTS